MKKIIEFLNNRVCYITAILSLVFPALLLTQFEQIAVFGWRKGLLSLMTSSVFSFLWIFIIWSICFFVFRPKWGRIVYGIATSVFIIHTFCQYVYFEIFGQFFWIKSILLAGEGADYLRSCFKYIDLKVVLFTLLSVTFMVITIVKWKKPHIKGKVKMVIVVFLIVILILFHIFMNSSNVWSFATDWDASLQPGVIYREFNSPNKLVFASGYYQFTFRDVWRTIFPSVEELSSENIEKVEEYSKSKTETLDNKYTGAFKGKNLIVVMLESIDQWMIDEKHTPTICKMMDEGITFENYFAPTFGSGHTFNSEFAFNTGHFNPISSVSAANLCGNSYPYALGHLFKNEGYAVNSFHFNNAEFYNRGLMHRAFGYEEYVSFVEMGVPVEKAKMDSYMLENDDIYNKMTEKAPFFDFVITASAHLPYDIETTPVSIAKQNHPELVNPDMDMETNNCMLLAADTDDFFKRLLERLDEDALLDNTVIVAFTDHYAYGFSDQELLAEYKNNDIIYRVPAFIYATDIDRMKVDKVMMTVDWVPTLINLFGLKNEGRYLGSDVFDVKNPGFAYFEDFSWFDGKMYYESSNPVSQVNTEYIEKQNARLKQMVEINELVIQSDYFAQK